MRALNNRGHNYQLVRPSLPPSLPHPHPLTQRSAYRCRCHRRSRDGVTNEVTISCTLATTTTTTITSTTRSSHHLVDKLSRHLQTRHRHVTSQPLSHVTGSARPAIRENRHVPLRTSCFVYMFVCLFVDSLLHDVYTALPTLQWSRGGAGVHTPDASTSLVSV